MTPAKASGLRAGGAALVLLLLSASSPSAQSRDLEDRLAALEAALRAQVDRNDRQQAVIDEQAEAIRDLRRQVRVPDELAGQPVLPADILLAPSADAFAGDQAVGSPVTDDAQTTRAFPPDLEARSAQDDGAPPSEGIDTLGESVRRALDTSRALALADLDRPRMTLVGGRPSFISPDGRYSLSLRGIAQLDTAFFDQDVRDPAADFRRGSIGAGGRETGAASDFSNGANFRRARLGAEGVFDRDWSYRLMFEFGGSGTEGPARINDAWIAYTGFAPLTVQFGAFSPPANMDDGQSPEDQLFLERASASELSRTLAGADGRIGLGFRGAGRRWLAAATLTGPSVNDVETFDEQLGLVGRAAALLLTDEIDNTYNVQVGLNGTRLFQAADQGAAASPRFPGRLRDRPELRVDGARLIDTGPIDADSVSSYGLELGAQYRSLFLQAEHFWFEVERRGSPFADSDFSGGYVEASWILTGESRRHNMATGSFQNPRPYATFSPRNGGYGAFELAARYSVMDLNDNPGAPGTAAIPGAVRGGEQSVWSAGLNWYPNSNLKFLLHYQRVEVDRLNPAGPGALAPFGAGAATPPLGARIGQCFDVISLRSQFAF